MNNWDSIIADINAAADHMNTDHTPTSYDLVIPSWAVCYIENGECSGLEDSEIELVDSFLEGLKKELGQGIFSYSEDTNFYFANDIQRNMGADCYTAKYTVI